MTSTDIDALLAEAGECIGRAPEPDTYELELIDRLSTALRQEQEGRVRAEQLVKLHEERGAPTEDEAARAPMKMLVDAEWLSRKVATDPDGLDTEATTPSPNLPALERARVALLFISNMRPGRKPDAETTALYDHWSDLQRGIFDRGEMHGYSRAWEAAADYASQALAELSNLTGKEG